MLVSTEGAAASGVASTAAGAAVFDDGEGAKIVSAAGGRTSPVDGSWPAGGDTSPAGGGVSTAGDGVVAASCALAVGR